MKIEIKLTLIDNDGAKVKEVAGSVDDIENKTSIGLVQTFSQYVAKKVIALKGDCIKR